MSFSILFWVILVLKYPGSSQSGLFESNLNPHFAEDLKSMVQEATLSSKCEGNVFVSTEECGYFINHALKSLRSWIPPVILLSFEFDGLTGDPSHHRMILSKWNLFLSRNLKPCSLIIICELIPELKNTTLERNESEFEEIEPGNLTKSPDEELILDRSLITDIGLASLRKFVSSYDKIIYFSNLPRWESQVGRVLEQAGNVLFLQLDGPSRNFWKRASNEGTYHVIHLCSFCAHSDKPNFLGVWRRNWTRFGEFIDQLDAFRGLRKFGGHPFSVGYLEYPPHFSCPIVQNNSRECFGVEWEMLKLMSSSLSFGVNLSNFSSTLPEETINLNETASLGALTGKTSGVIKLLDSVAEKKIDLGVGGISVTSEREGLVDFSQIFSHEPIVFVVEKTQEIYILGIWLAFRPSFWALLIGITILIGLLIKFLLRIEFGQGFLISLTSLLGQPISFSRRRRFYFSLLRLKLILASWWFAGFIITNFYNSNLISSLINPLKSPKDPESLGDLIKFGYHFKLGSKQAVAVKELIENESVGKTIPQIAAIKKRLIRSPAESEGAGNLQIDPRFVAYVVEESAVEQIDWAKLLGPGGEIKIIKERLFLTGYGWSLRSNAPYKHVIDQGISRLAAAGLIEHWYGQYSHKEREPTERKFRLRKKLGQIHIDLRILQGAFIFLLIGIGVGGVVFLVEFSIQKYGIRPPRKEELKRMWNWLARRIESSRRVYLEDDEMNTIKLMEQSRILMVAPVLGVSNLDLAEEFNAKKWREVRLRRKEARERLEIEKKGKLDGKNGEIAFSYLK